LSYLERVCRRILALDGSIRFVGIVSIDGEIMITQYREGLIPLLSKEETAQSIIDSVMRMKIRRNLEAKLGKTILVIALYENVKRIAIPIGKTGENLLIVSLDIDSDHDTIIWKKIMPIIETYSSLSEEYKV
jgi:hypothetical protein